MFGNPPFVGAKFQTTEQRAQVRRIADLGRSGGTLDYVTAWFLRAGEYVRGGEALGTDSGGPLDETPAPAAGAQRRRARIGFVATNSIAQGEQVAQFWPLIFDRLGLEIAFAHRTFAWGSDARGVAHVHVVIVGLTVAADAPTNRRLFSYPYLKGDAEESVHAAISPYLFDADGLANPHVVVRQTVRQINGLPRMIIGSKPIDGGRYIFKEKERDAFLEKEPGAEPFLRPYVGSREYLQGGGRYILALHDAQPEVLSGLPHVRERIASVRAYRSASKSKPTRDLALTPKLYHVNVLPTEPFLVVPKVSSERREYVPIGWLEPPTVPSDLVFVLQGATKPLFALLTSAMHMAWLRQIGGRLKSDYRYSIGSVYNTFPPPPAEPGSPRTADSACRRRPHGSGRAPRRHPGRALRPRSDASRPAPRPPSHRPRGRSSLPPASLPDRERAAGAPPRAVRTDADPDCRRGRARIQAPPAANHSAVARMPRRGSSATCGMRAAVFGKRRDSGTVAGRWQVNGSRAQIEWEALSAVDRRPQVALVVSADQCDEQSAHEVSHLGIDRKLDSAVQVELVHSEAERLAHKQGFVQGVVSDRRYSGCSRISLRRIRPGRCLDAQFGAHPLDPATVGEVTTLELPEVCRQSVAPRQSRCRRR